MPLTVAVLVTVAPGAPAVMTGPTTHTDDPAGGSGSTYEQDAVLTIGSLMARPMTSWAPLLATMKR